MELLKDGKSGGRVPGVAGELTKEVFERGGALSAGSGGGPGIFTGGKPSGERWWRTLGQLPHRIPISKDGKWKKLQGLCQCQ